MRRYGNVEGSRQLEDPSVTMVSRKTLSKEKIGGRGHEWRRKGASPENSLYETKGGGKWVSKRELWFGSFGPKQKDTFGEERLQHCNWGSRR